MSLEAASIAGPQAAHFGSDEARQRAAHVGMWVFLGSELLLFAALFATYGVYRVSYPDAFHAGKEHMELTLGTINTYILVVTSVLVALADAFVKRGRDLLAALLLFIVAAGGLAFLAIKGMEYHRHFEEGLWPGVYYAGKDFAVPGASLYLTIYFIMTGLHAVHVTIGVCVVFTLGCQLMSGKYSAAYHTPVELGGMYWHLIDVIWLFLWAILYLA